MSITRTRKRIVCLTLAVVLVAVTSARPVAAQQAGLSDDQVKERLAYIETALNAGKPRAETWYYFWLFGDSTVALVTGMVAGSHWYDKNYEGPEPVPDREGAEGVLVFGATFALGACFLLFDPFEPAFGTDNLKAVPGDTPEERLAKLGRAEEMLRDCARREKRGRSLTNHLLSLGTNAAAALAVKGIFHQSWTKALTTMAVSEAFSLLTIFSQPTRATRDLANYEAKYLKTGAVLPPPPERRWTLGIGPGVLSLRYEF